MMYSKEIKEGEELFLYILEHEDHPGKKRIQFSQTDYTINSKDNWLVGWRYKQIRIKRTKKGFRFYGLEGSLEKRIQFLFDDEEKV